MRSEEFFFSNTSKMSSFKRTLNCATGISHIENNLEEGKFPMGNSCYQNSGH